MNLEYVPNSITEETFDEFEILEILNRCEIDESMEYSTEDY